MRVGLVAGAVSFAAARVGLGVSGIGDMMTVGCDGRPLVAVASPLLDPPPQATIDDTARIIAAPDHSSFPRTPAPTPKPKITTALLHQSTSTVCHTPRNGNTSAEKRVVRRGR
jgi:hypothetical protein